LTCPESEGDIITTAIQIVMRTNADTNVTGTSCVGLHGRVTNTNVESGSCATEQGAVSDSNVTDSCGAAPE